jgi:hypothetical protein
LWSGSRLAFHRRRGPLYLGEAARLSTFGGSTLQNGLSASDDFADRRVMKVGEVADLPQGQARLLGFLKDLASCSVSARGLELEFFLCRLDGFAESFAFGGIRHPAQRIPSARLRVLAPAQRARPVTDLCCKRG